MRNSIWPKKGSLCLTHSEEIFFVFHPGHGLILLDEIPLLKKNLLQNPANLGADGKVLDGLNLTGKRHENGDIL